MAYKNPAFVYKEARVTTAGQGQLILMLYDEAIKNLDKATEAINTYNTGGKHDHSMIEKIGNGLTRADEIVGELQASLDMDAGKDIAQNLFALYQWFKSEIFESNISLDDSRIRAVRTQMSDLRGAWAQISDREAGFGAAPTGINIAG
jgi:flagellar protein FliS